MHGEQANRNDNVRPGRRRFIGILLFVLAIAFSCAAFILGANVGAKGQIEYISNLMSHQNSLVQDNTELRSLNDLSESIIEGYKEDAKSIVEHEPIGVIPIPPGEFSIVDKDPPVVPLIDPSALEDGSWHIGEDFEAGTYYSREATGSSCYWAIFSGGNAPADLVKNGLTDGAHSGVQLNDGETFQTWGCGVWKPE